MQIGSFKPYTLRYDTLGVIERINKLSHYFRMNNYKVIFVQHDGTKENIFLPNTSDWELLPELVTSPSDDIVSNQLTTHFIIQICIIP